MKFAVGECLKCGGRLVEAQVRFVNRAGESSRVTIDPKGATIKTKCVECGAFVGYRPVERTSRQRTQDHATAGGL